MRRRLALAAVVSLLAAACDFGGAGAAPAEGVPAPGWQDELAAETAALSVDHEAELRFQADWNVVQSNLPIYAGGRLKVVYDVARLPSCRAVYNGLPSWKIVMYWRALPDPTVRETTLAIAGQGVAQAVAVPEGATGIEAWFLGSDYQGCREWDSNLDANYHFPVRPPTAVATATFAGDWTEAADRPIVQGGLLRIDYAPSRLRACRATYNGGRTWNILAGWVFQPGGETGTVALYDGDYYAGEAAIRQPQVPVPAGATSVALWFSNSDRAGCVAWDSDYGANYTFPVVPAEGGGAPPVGWAGDWDFVVFHRDPGTHYGDRDPAWYWDSMAGAETAAWIEVQVWIPGLTDRAYGSADALRAAAATVRAEAVTDAFEGEGPEGWGTVALDFARRQGNNFVYTFRFWQLRYSIYHDPAIAAGLHHYYARFSTDGGATWFDAGAADGGARRFVVAPQQDCALFPDHPPAECPQDRPVGWAGRWGAYVTHACYWQEGVPDPVTFRKSSVGHDCMDLTADVWVAGVTDAGGNPDALLAEVETDIAFSGGPLEATTTYRLSFDQRAGNDFRYKWSLGEHVARADRGDYRYRFRFSADGGRTWTTLGTGEGDGWRRLLVRNDSQDTDDVEYCDGLQLWTGSTGTYPHCVDYQPDAPYDATNCEFYVNAFGRGQLSHNGAWARWVEAWVSVAPQQGTPLGVGLWVRYHDAQGQPGERFSFGNEVEPGYWLTGFTDGRNIPGGVADPDVTIDAFAFFLDVRRPTGEVVRLWQSAGGANYTLEETFAAPGYVHGIGVGSIEYADESVPLFAAKHACL